MLKVICILSVVHGCCANVVSLVADNVCNDGVDNHHNLLSHYHWYTDQSIQNIILSPRPSFSARYSQDYNING